ncbi:MAG TPA: hypothetical protein VFG55_04780 [Rhodanobacteraceae bacterium]|nr:hypothetical protein [Rhodanobacteraceae bacterium]
MWLLSLILLILLGLLGIASWLKSRRPEVAGHLGPLESVEGWIGLLGLIWGLFLLLRWIASLGVMSSAPGLMLIALITALAIAALGLILALPLLRSLIGDNRFTGTLADLTGKLLPYKVGFGFVCLALALYSLLSAAF